MAISDTRRAEIEQAAFELLDERGFENMSMLTIAKRSRASNETLYRLYGDKHGLVAALTRRSIDDMVAEVVTLLEKTDADVIETLSAAAVYMIRTIAGDRLTALDRAAAADRTGQIGAAMIEHGRDRLSPVIERVIARGCAAGLFAVPSTAVATGWFMVLVMGDLRTRRMFHQLASLSEAEIADRATTAVAAFRKLAV